MKQAELLTTSSQRPDVAGPMQPLAVLVLGVHRSGTSALSGVLNLLGIAVPGELLPPAGDNIKGFFESKKIVAFHDRVLEKFDSRWDDPLPLSGNWMGTPVGASMVRELSELIENEMGTEPMVLVKDPRMCRLVPLWVDAMALQCRRIVSLLPVRHPLEVAGSLQTRNGFARAHSLMLWARDMLAVEHSTRRLDRSFVSYEALLSGWRSIIHKIEQDVTLNFPRDKMRAEKDVDEFLSTELRHHSATQLELNRDDPLERLCAEIWTALAALQAKSPTQKELSGFSRL